MELVPLTPDDSTLRRYVTELWLPYNRELSEVVSSFDLTDEHTREELIDAEIAFRRDWLDEADRRAWLAVDGEVTDPGTDGEVTGFVTCEGDPAPSVFDRPDRVTIGDIYVRPPFRGIGLADRLVDRVAEHARDEDYEELRLEVHEANDRAKSFYRSLGFETHRRVMTVPTDRIWE